MEFISHGLDLFQKGGLVMYFLLLCSIFVGFIAIERGMYFSSADAGRNFGRRFYDLMTQNEYNDALQYAINTKGTLPELIVGAMKLASTGDEAVAAYMEVNSGVALSHLRKRLYYLNVIVTMAPLLGLLGTISGMISAFSVFNLDAGGATAITGGVGEALIATAFGLMVAIFALVVHSYYVQRIEGILTDMEQSFSLIEGKRLAIVEKKNTLVFNSGASA